MQGTALSSAKAISIIEELQIREPSEIHLTDMAMNRGVYVRERLLEGAEARLVRKGRSGIIAVNSAIPEEGRKRFAIAHELGHFELHANTQLIECTEKDMLVWNDSQVRELEANDFASNLLMPKEIFLRHIGNDPPNLQTAKDLSQLFRTTLTAATLRYVELSRESCALVVCKEGIIKWYKPSPSFDFHVRVRDRLSRNTYAADFFDGVELPPRPDTVPAAAWLTGEIDDEAWIIEQSIALKRYGVVLSLLWIKDDIRSSRRKREDGDDEPEHDLTNPFTPDGKRWRWD